MHKGGLKTGAQAGQALALPCHPALPLVYCDRRGHLQAGPKAAHGKSSTRGKGTCGAVACHVSRTPTFLAVPVHHIHVLHLHQGMPVVPLVVCAPMGAQVTSW
jgi:hypothetical protein